MKNTESNEILNSSELLQIDEMKIIGLSIRTTNKDGRSIKEQGEFWQNFFRNNNIEKIPNKLYPNEILGIYHNYESDYTGEYDFLIGFEVSSLEIIPDGFTFVIIPGGNYSVFRSDKKMDIGTKIGNLWRDIWQSKITRTYEYDIEEYELSTMSSENPKVTIYIGTKPR